MAKGRNSSTRHHHAKRSSSTVALVLSMLLMLTLVLLILLALGILSLPVSSDDAPPGIRGSFNFGRRAGVWYVFRICFYSLRINCVCLILPPSHFVYFRWRKAYSFGYIYNAK